MKLRTTLRVFSESHDSDIAHFLIRLNHINENEIDIRGLGVEYSLRHESLINFCVFSCVHVKGVFCALFW